MNEIEYYLKYGLNAEEIAEREYLIEGIVEMLEEISNIRKIRMVYEFVGDLVR